METSEIEPMLFFDCSSSIKQESVFEPTACLSDSLNYSPRKPEELNYVKSEKMEEEQDVTTNFPCDVDVMNHDQSISNVIDISYSSSGGSTPILVENDILPESCGFTLSKELIERLEAIAKKSPSKTEDIKYSCSQCEFSCSLPKEMADHQSKCWLERNSEPGNNAMGEQNSVNFQCSVNVLNGHVTYCCQLCEFNTKSNKTIKQHCYDSHKHQGSCGMCGKIFKHFGSLARHVKTAHPTPAPAPDHASLLQPRVVLTRLSNTQYTTLENVSNSLTHNLKTKHSKEDLNDASQNKSELDCSIALKHEVIDIVDIQDPAYSCQDDSTLIYNNNGSNEPSNEMSQMLLSLSDNRYSKADIHVY